MKTTSKKFGTFAVAALCFAMTTGLRADQRKDYPNPASDTTTSETTPSRANKASSLVGMSVKNQSDEHLGHIKDIVIDLKTEKVAYAVMAVSGTGTLGINEKLVAVPLGAFTVSADDHYLILNADKSKLEAAAGIEKGAWPSVTNPSWGAEPFWKSSGASDYNNSNNNNNNNNRTDNNNMNKPAEQQSPK